MTRSRFDIEYSKWLRQIEVKEDDSVWNEIQDELDFIETWDNISHKLDEVKSQKSRVVPIRYLKVIAAAAAIILVMFLPVRYFIEQANQPVTISELSNNEDKKQAEASDDSAPLKTATEEEGAVNNQMVEPEIPTVKNLDEKMLASSPSREITPIAENNDSETDALSNEEQHLHRMQALPFDENTHLVSTNVILPHSIETEFYVIPESDEATNFSFRVVEVGLVYGYKNTWLLNHETWNGLNPKKLGNTLPTFHQDIGVLSTLEFNNMHRVGVEFLWKSEAGQNYQQYINASFVDRNINLDYLKLQAFYLWETKKIPGQAIIGGYAARLTMAEEQQEKAKFSVQDNYSDLDFGLLAGYQFNIAFMDRVMLKPGIRFSYNFINIFEGDDITPSYFKNTKNFAASFNISLSYRFNK